MLKETAAVRPPFPFPIDGKIWLIKFSFCNLFETTATGVYRICLHKELFK